MIRKILFVDDEPRILEGYRRQLRKRYEIATAVGPVEGLETLGADGPFAVVVSDLKMPGMNGVEFLASVRERSPDSVRVMLTGQADLSWAIAAVNEGNIFRFLTKPCSADVLSNALDAALEQYRLVRAEQELLEDTVKGAIQVMTEVLGIVNPAAFSRTSSVRGIVRTVLDVVQVPARWDLEMASMLAHIGCVAIPTGTLEKLYAGQPLTEEEARLVKEYPSISRKLLASIPRLEGVAEIVGSAAPMLEEEPAALPGGEAGDPYALEKQILRAAVAMDRWMAANVPQDESLNRLRRMIADLDPRILDALRNLPRTRSAKIARSVRAEELTLFMVVDEDVFTKTGVRLVRRGQEISYPLLERLRSFSRNVGIREPIRVLVARNEGRETPQGRSASDARERVAGR